MRGPIRLDDELTRAESMRRQRVPRIGLHIKPPAGLCLSARPRLLVQGTFPGERDDMHVQHSILCYTHGMHGVPGLGRERRVFDAVVDMDNELQRGSARAMADKSASGNRHPILGIPRRRAT